MDKSDKIRVIKKADQPERFIERHEVSLLALLIEKHPQRAKEFLARLKGSMKVAA